ncbi:hypothetical protein M501DRAFT_1004979 [Patellaria atrata CBS 101060]|uniref:BZIP domain-containing protein n=1 Tax=Patellaria atrata CBS 101060 TaxID=1346257 RepID=A0A9P4SAF1_9PEZI|nr:hypothetical protein M501DRAFT_1004979 [Patellaria atrata CBS 101060]
MTTDFFLVDQPDRGKARAPPIFNAINYGPSSSYGTPNLGGSSAVNPSSSMYQYPSLLTVDTSSAPTFRQEYGQVTPPDDVGPSDGDASLATSPVTQVKKRDSAIEPEKKAGRRKRKDGPVRKSRKQRQPEPELVPEDPEEAAKRNAFLERNRLAASKCRQKKKEWTQDLEKKARELAAERAYLMAQVSELKNNILFLKDECLKHSNCGCTRIRDYLQREAQLISPSQVPISLGANPNRPYEQMSSIAGPSTNSPAFGQASFQYGFARSQSIDVRKDGSESPERYLHAPDSPFFQRHREKVQDSKGDSPTPADHAPHRSGANGGLPSSSGAQYRMNLDTVPTTESMDVNALSDEDWEALLTPG